MCGGFRFTGFQAAMCVDKAGRASLSESVESSCRPFYRTILFDLDGTLVDQFRVIYEAYAHTMQEMGLPPVTYEQVRGAVGGSITVTFGKLVPAQHVDEAVARFREEFRRSWDRQVDVLPGVPELLSSLHQRGHQLAVLTNKDGDLARQVVEKAGLSPFFSRVFGTLDTPWRKPDVEFTRHALSELGAQPAETCLIGDSPYDVATAVNAGLDCFAVATGSHSTGELREACPGIPVHPNMSALARSVFGLDGAECLAGHA
jgi:HAD superfamily hydrolase (TIGR01509 family)